MEDPRRREVALFRYGLFREVADPDLSPRRAGRPVRQLAAKERLSTEQLEQLRLLTNTDMDSRSSLGLILLGQSSRCSPTTPSA